MKTLRYFLLTLTITACASSQLEAMKRPGEQDQPSRLESFWDYFRAFGDELAKRIPENRVAEPSQITLPETYQQISEQLLPELAAYILSLQINHDPIAFARTLTHQEIQSLFDKFQEESIFKMALRLGSAKEHGTNLDDLDCVYFVNNIDMWVNGDDVWHGQTTPMLSQANLPYVLPLLEALIGAPVTKLNLSQQPPNPAACRDW